ncbi:MAG: hypothetical protein GY716_14400 [bacterium]|nr:hypothetical protein [bacterium]
MNRSLTTRYALCSGLVALVGAAAVAAVALPRGETTVRFGLWGWLMMALPGVAGGAWLAGVHGKPGTGFLFALAAAIAARVVLAGLGALPVIVVGREAILPYAAGLGAGFFPLQVFEVAWFVRRTAKG